MRQNTNLCFASDINGFAGEEEERAKLVEHCDKAFTAYSMEISAERTKLMTTPVASVQRLKEMNRSLRQLQVSSTWAHL